jgi:hypothetical protein
MEQSGELPPMYNACTIIVLIDTRISHITRMNKVSLMIKKVFQ